MMKTDGFGCTVTLCDDTALAAWNATVRAFLAHAADTPTHLCRVFETAPDFALAHSCHGLFCLLLGRRELVADAHRDLARARASAADDPVTPRENHYIDALAAWISGMPSYAIKSLERAIEIAPGDALAVKLSHAIRFMLGDSSGMRASLEAVIDQYDDDHPAAGYIHGCFAFALEETGDYGRAEAHGRRGLDLAADDAWGLHAIAHVYDMTDRAEDGVAWLSARPKAWEHCNNFRYHVWWHLALHHLELGAIDAVLDLYDREVRHDHTDDFRDLSNGASLLARLELEGVDVGDRWDELAEIAARRVDDGCVVFADLHYLMALFGKGDRENGSRLITRMKQDALRSGSEMDVVFRTAGLPAADGLEAFWAGRHMAAFQRLGEARRHLVTIGGSHAQRDVFERLTIEAGLRAGAIDETLALIEDRARRRGSNDQFGRARLATISERAASRAGVQETA